MIQTMIIDATSEISNAQDTSGASMSATKSSEPSCRSSVVAEGLIEALPKTAIRSMKMAILRHRDILCESVFTVTSAPEINGNARERRARPTQTGTFLRLSLHSRYELKS
jgi:hypothetical protein